MAPILVSLDAGSLSLTLNRPEKLNAFNPEMHKRLREALEERATTPPCARCCSPARAAASAPGRTSPSATSARAPRRSISR